MNLTDSQLLSEFRKLFIDFYPPDIAASFWQIKNKYDSDMFWSMWKEIKARKLEYKKPNELYIGIVGTRRRNTDKDYQIIKKVVGDLNNTWVWRGNNKLVLVSGLCSKGADRFAVDLYKTYRTRRLWFPAQWEKYGKEAGFIRNTDVAKVSEQLHTVVAPDRRGGTEDTIAKFIMFHGKEKLFIY